MTTATDLEPLEFIEEALGQLQTYLPHWWRKEDPDAELYKWLAAIAGRVDHVSHLFERVYLNTNLETADVPALIAEWAWLYGVDHETLPGVGDKLREYLKAVVAESGTIDSFITSLLRILATEVNTVGTQLVFPSDGSGFTFGGTIPASTPLFAPTPLVVAAADAFSSDSIGAGLWAFDAGAGTLAVSGGKLVPSSTANKRLRRTDVQPANAVATVRIEINTAALAAENMIRLVEIDDNNVLRVGYVNPTTLAIKKVDLGVVSTLGPTATLNTSLGLPSVVWLRAIASDNDITVEHWTTDPALGGGLPDTSLTYTLAGADATKFGRGQQGYPGLYLTPADVAWRYDDYMVYVQPLGIGPLFQAVPAPRSKLIFPPDGSGFTFPAPRGLTFPGDGSGLTLDPDPAGGLTFPPAPTPGLVFGDNGYVNVIERSPDTNRFTVITKSWLNFDRGSFARAIERQRQAHLIPYIVEQNT